MENELEFINRFEDLDDVLNMLGIWKYGYRHLGKNFMNIFGKS